MNDIGTAIVIPNKTLSLPFINRLEKVLDFETFFNFLKSVREIFPLPASLLEPLILKFILQSW